MKTITIPAYNNPFTVIINNRAYQYKGGETIEVPDEVAEAIEDALALAPKYDPRAGQGVLTDFLNVLGRNVTDIDVPKETTVIGTYSFAYCLELSSVTLHEGLKTIGASAFSRDAALKSIEFPSTVTTIGTNAFYMCAALEKAVFLGTPNVINASAFAECTDLKDIYVPWAEGEVADAPWGATNATIHYNSTQKE